MTTEQKQALRALDRSIKRFERAYAEILLAQQAMELAMRDCARVNDVSAVRR